MSWTSYSTGFADFARGCTRAHGTLAVEGPPTSSRNDRRQRWDKVLAVSSPQNCEHALPAFGLQGRNATLSADKILVSAVEAGEVTEYLHEPTTALFDESIAEQA